MSFSRSINVSNMEHVEYLGETISSHDVSKEMKVKGFVM